MTPSASITVPAGSKLFCFGYGYCAEVLARALGPSVAVAGTRRAVTPASNTGIALAGFEGSHASPEVTRLLERVTHVLLSIPPDAAGDPALRWHGDDLARLTSLKWIGYLSTVGVYGDAQGGWVDETTPLAPASERGARRKLAEEQWRAFGQASGKRVEIFRLPGIYGPGRSAIDDVRQGTARRLIKSGQVFNRIHVADIATTLTRAMALASAGADPGFDTFNVTDDEPCPPQDVVAYAAALLGVAAPPDVQFDPATLSPMTVSFYGESKRVSNQRLKVALGVRLAYPSYREGLAALVGEG